MPAVAGIGLIQLPTVAAFAPSSSLHESLRNEAPIMRSGSRTCRKKTQTEEEENDGRRAFKSNELKKIDRKNTAFSNRLIYRTFGTALTY
jgi:hypothetical protein